MRIIWVKVGALWPVDRGGRRRSFEIVSELSRRHHVVVLTTHGPDDDPAGQSRALPRCEVMSLPYTIPHHGTPRFATNLLGSWLSRLPVDLYKTRVPALYDETTRRLATGAVDLVIADFLTGLINVPVTNTPTILFSHNVEHLLWRRLAENEPHLMRRAALAVEWRKMRRAERRALARVDRVIAVSDIDRDALTQLAPSSRVRTVPTGVDLDYFATNGHHERAGALVFTGAMDWYPNQDAVSRFLREVMPLIKREKPQAHLTIVGRNPSSAFTAAATQAGATVTGTVPDVRWYLAQAAVVVAPLRIAGGTRLKIFEALAMGKAVVSTRIGAEGLPVVDGEHLVIADEPEELARRIVALLDDPARRRSIGAAGRRLVEERYAWSRVTEEFVQCCKEVSHAS